MAGQAASRAGTRSVAPRRPASSIAATAAGTAASRVAVTGVDATAMRIVLTSRSLATDGPADASGRQRTTTNASISTLGRPAVPATRTVTVRVADVDQSIDHTIWRPRYAREYRSMVATFVPFT